MGRSPSFEYVSAFNKEAYKGLKTAQEIKDHFQYLLENEFEIKDSILAYLNSSDKHKRRRSDTKKKIVDDTFEKFLEKLIYVGGDSFMWSPFQETKRVAIERCINALTDEKIKEAVEKREAENAFYKKAFENPETLDEFCTFIHYKGEDALTADQKAHYDELIAEQEKVSRQREIERKTTVTQVTTDASMTLIETKHTRDGYDLFVVQLSERVEREVFNELNSKAKHLGGWYSSFRGNGAVPGFQFKEKSAAEKFMSLKEGDVSQTEEVLEKKEESKTNAAERLLEMADDLEAKANESLNKDRLANTVRRARMADSAEKQARRDIAFAKTMRNLAKAIQSGEAKHLDGVRAKTHIETLDRLLRQAKYDAARAEENANRDNSKIWNRQPELSDMDFVQYPFPSIYSSHLNDIIRSLSSIGGGKLIAQRLQKKQNAADSDKNVVFDDDREIEMLRKAKNKVIDKWEKEKISGILENYDRLQSMGIKSINSLRAALREFFLFKEGISEADPLKKIEREICLRPIPGFFPTPPDIVELILEHAAIEPGMKVLEPSAGKGNIVDAVRDSCPEVDLTCIECNSALAEILRLKGHNVINGDFLEHKGEYDRIVMNPPFENLQDIDHVMHAYSLLKEGGILVSIMSESPFFRQDNKAVEFREWLDCLDGVSERLESGAFKNSERSTGVNTRIVYITKAEREITATVEALIKKCPAETTELISVMAATTVGDVAQASLF